MPNSNHSKHRVGVGEASALAESLPKRESPQWQNLLNVKRLYNGGKKAAVKVSEHFSQENVWGKGLVAFIEGVSEDVK